MFVAPQLSMAFKGSLSNSFAHKKYHVIVEESLLLMRFNAANFNYDIVLAFESFGERVAQDFKIQLFAVSMVHMR